MNFDRFLGQVQDRARLSDTQKALRATRATLQTLAERINCNEAKDLASQLPEEIGLFLQCEPYHTSERFSLEEFFLRVSERESVDLPAATYHARVVVEVLQEAVTPGEIKDVMAQLPPEFERLFVAGSTGSM